jgi:hypothetical protein
MSITAHTGSNERLLTPGEVAALFRVDPKTVTRWPDRLDPHARRPPAVPRVRGAQHAGRPHERGHAAARPSLNEPRSQHFTPPPHVLG